MFNSIRKDDSCRKLVKSFEILRLQNKIIVQAMSKPDVFSVQAEKTSEIAFTSGVAKRNTSGESVAFAESLFSGKDKRGVMLFNNASIKLNTFSTSVEEKKPLLLSTKPLNLTLQNEKLSITKGDLASCKTSFYKKVFATRLPAEAKAKKSKPFAINDKTNKAFFSYNCFTDLELCKSSLHFFAKKKVKAENENKITNFSIFAKNKRLDDKLLFLAKGRIISLPRNSSKSRIKNRCIETGRSHSVLRFCKLSRICLRDNASKGLISGMSKASW